MSSSRSIGLALALAALTLALVPSAMPSADTDAASSATAGAVDVALAYAGANAAELGVARADVADLFVMSTVASRHNGVTHVNLNQRYQGREVFGGHSTVSVGRNGKVVFAAGSFVADLGASASGQAKLDATAAVEAAADALEVGGGASASATPARLGWQPTKDGLRLAWQVTIDASSDADLWNAAVDAETGELLKADNWTDRDNLGDLSATLSRSGVAFSTLSEPGSPNPVIDGSSYRVLEIPKESPNDGPFSVVDNPADGDTSPFGWHDDNGIAGADYTITRGNNAHAYQDQDDDEAMDFGGSPDGTNSLDFLFTADLSEHPQAYREAATTNLFYWNNVFHDITTRYGFDEAADNFQAINYGGGPFSNGDYVRAEAADGSGTNNANFSTPALGGTPRMQMFLWPGNQFGSQNQVVVDGGATFGAAWAR
ncbi:MAG: M36 family metallopeptidase, partial [Candidatus Rokuibacteriota bacterium]